VQAHAALGTLVSVAIVLAAAHAGGLVARRLGQPAVIGQLLAGVVIGPTVLGTGPDDPAAQLGARTRCASSAISARSASSRSRSHYVFGAFAFGVVFARPSLAPLAAVPVRVATWLGLILLPLYLVVPGATTNFRDLDLAGGGEVLVVLLVATVSKLLAGGVSAHAAGLAQRDAFSVGVMLNTRGLVELVALGIGLSAGLLDSSLYAVLVVMAVVTTVATSPALRALGVPRAR
jgi:Kef-type K+ transport system membrane component KefB